MIFSTVRVGNREIHGIPAAKVFKVMGFVLLGIVGITALAVIFGLIVMWLWNALMPDIFNLPEIGYWQGVGLVVLAHIFFGSEHKTFSNRGSRRSKHSHGEEKQVYINKNGHERHYDSFREFWNDYGRDAFDKWLNRKDAKPDQTSDTE